MPIAVHSDDAGNYEQPISLAGAMQITAPNLPTPLPLQIGIGATWDSGIVVSDGFKAITVGVKGDHAGTLNVLRYIDLAGTIQQGSTSTAAIVANTPLILNVYDNLPFVTFKVQIVNAGGAVMNITATDFAILMNAT